VPITLSCSLRTCFNVARAACVGRLPSLPSNSLTECVRCTVSDDDLADRIDGKCITFSQTDCRYFTGGANMTDLLRKLWSHEEGQDIAEYAVMLAVILVLVIGTVRLVGGNANNAFSTVASSIG
jgi:Flp pilus assembly pilin Flp